MDCCVIAVLHISPRVLEKHPCPLLLVTGNGGDLSQEGGVLLLELAW